MKSIIQDNKECFMTGDTSNLHKHHIYFGANRKVSEEYGFWCWLRWDCHIANSPNPTPHNDRQTDLNLKRYCQSLYEEKHSREEFIKLIGRSYI